METRLTKLLTVKSLVTLSLTIMFNILAFKGVISGSEFLTIFTIVIGFYFGTQSKKGEDLNG
jgi:hypothetical protein